MPKSRARVRLKGFSSVKGSAGVVFCGIWAENEEFVAKKASINAGLNFLGAGSRLFWA